MKITKRESIVRVLIILALILVIVLISVVTDKKGNAEDVPEYDTIHLNTGVNLDNWLPTLKETTVPADSIFMMREGNIYVTGEPWGYIKTKEKYSDYQLFVEWRWVEEPGNSGVFIHVDEDKIWPVCVECQLKTGNAGDLVCFKGFDFVEHVDKSILSVKKLAETSEKLAGEWNTYDIRVMADSISVYVNGVFQNVASKTSKVSGSIALQSEGAPIEFRNVFLVKERE